MKYTPSVLLFGLMSLSAVFALKLPPVFKRCRVSPELDNLSDACMKQAVSDAIRYLTDNGDQTLGALDLDPLRIKEILISQEDKSRPVSLSLTFKDVDLIGLGGIDIKTYKGKTSSPENFYMELTSRLPSIALVGKYKIQGSVLILPIVGQGFCNITLDKLGAVGSITAVPQMKNGKEYLKVTGVKLKLDVTRVYYRFDNLFNGNKELGDTMNRFLNDNWSEIFSELQPAVEEAIGKVFEEYARRILERIQFKNIFLLN